MSHGKKSKRKKKQHRPGNEHSEGGAKLDHKPRHVFIDGKIEANFPPNLIEKYDTASDKDNSWDRKHFVVGIITIVLLFVYTSFTAWQAVLTRKIAKLTQETYETSQRPYVGIFGFAAFYFSNEGGGPQKQSATLFSNAEGFSVIANIKNFGPVPAENFVATWKVFLNNVERHGAAKIPDTPSVLNPTQQVSLKGGVPAGDEMNSIATGKGILDIELTISYDKPTGHIIYCQRHEYIASINSFADLGNCTH